MNVRKVLVTLVAVVVIAAASVGAWVLTAGARRGAAIAAKVNGDVIYWSQIDAEVARAAAQFGLDPANKEFEKQRNEIVKTVVDQLVTQRLIVQEARRRNLVASDKDVDAQIDTIRKRFPNEADFTAALTRNGLTMSALRDLIRIQLSQRKVADTVAQGTVTDDEVRKQFDSNRSAYDKPAQIKVSHILFRITEKGQESLAAAKARIAQAKLADGAKFEDVAKQSSEDPGSAERGGDLGYVSKGTLVKEFEEAAWGLKPGDTSGPVRTQYGLHIIRVYEVKPAEQAQFDKVKDEIRQQLLTSKREKAFESWLEQQRKTATIEKFDRR
ncbi:MAG: peptidylprolyl isomerase [Armatimonadota bacterium]